MNLDKTVSLSELQDCVNLIVSKICSSSVILLSGDLGVGKTQFVKFLVQKLSNKTVFASSPTFSIHNSYEFKKFVIEHFDFYRLKSQLDLESTGFWDVISLAYVDKSCVRVLVVEWPEILSKGFDLPTVLVNLSYSADSCKRNLKVSFIDACSGLVKS